MSSIGIQTNSEQGSGSDKPHILHIAPTPFFSDRGCHIRIQGIVRCLNNLGYTNLVCTYHNGREVAGIATERISKVKGYTKTQAGPSKYKPFADLKLACLSFKQYRKLEPVAIHAHLHEGLFIAILIKKLLFWRKITIIADLQGSFTGELETYNMFTRYPWLKIPCHLFERYTLWFANHIICSSEHAYQQTKQLGKIKPNKITVVQDGADKKTPLSASERQKIKQKLGLNQTKTIVVYSGALLNSKGLDKLKETIKGLSKHQDSLHFLVIGYPTIEIADFLEEEKLSSFCTVLGQVKFDDLSDYLQISDIAIDPKQSDAGEASGKIMGYLSCGLPVVAFNTPNNRIFLGEDAMLADDNTELQKHILSYHTQVQLRKDVALQNKKRFATHFSWDLSQKILNNIYKKEVMNEAR